MIIYLNHLLALFKVCAQCVEFDNVDVEWDAEYERQYASIVVTLQQFFKTIM